MTRRRLLVASCVAASALSAVLACSSDEFTSGTDAGADAASDAVVDVRTDTQDSAVDSGPTNWCARNAPINSSCADFDTVTTVGQLAPTWNQSPVPFGSLTLAVAPSASVFFDGGGPSSPTQLKASVSRLDSSQAIAWLDTVRDGAKARLSIDFELLPPTNAFGPGQSVMISLIGIEAVPQSDSLLIRLIRNSGGWILDSSAVLGQVTPVNGKGTLDVPGWHHVRLVLDKASATYQLYVDGTAIKSDSLALGWPTKLVRSACGVGVGELTSLDIPTEAYIDNVVCLSE